MVEARRLQRLTLPDPFSIAAGPAFEIWPTPLEQSGYRNEQVVTPFPLEPDVLELERQGCHNHFVLIAEYHCVAVC